MFCIFYKCIITVNRCVVVRPETAEVGSRSDHFPFRGFRSLPHLMIIAEPEAQASRLVDCSHCLSLSKRWSKCRQTTKRRLMFMVEKYTLRISHSALRVQCQICCCRSCLCESPLQTPSISRTCKDGLRHCGRRPTWPITVSRWSCTNGQTKRSCFCVCVSNMSDSLYIENNNIS